MIQRFDRLYAASRQVMHAILRSPSPNELLNDLTRVMVEHGGFAMASAALQDTASRELIPVASHGDTGGYLERIRIFTDERPEGLGPAGTAFRSGRICVVNDFLNDPRTQVWSEPARVARWRASASIPIRVAGTVTGILGVYATEVGYFGDEERELLEQVALDVGFGLESLEKDRRRRQAEASLAAAERRLEMALEAGGIAIFERDLQTGLIVSNAWTERLLGYEPGKFDRSQASFFSGIHPDDMARLTLALDRSRDTRTAYSCEYRVVWPDGSVHWMNARGEFSYGASGQATLLRGAFQDITKRKQAEEAGIRANERFRQAMDALLEGCALLDFNWTYLYVNEAAARNAMDRPGNMIGKTILRLVPGVESSAAFARLRQCMEERIPQQFETAYQFPNGVVRHYELSVSPVPEGIFVLSLDTTERRRAEVALRENEERLRQALLVSNIGIFDHDHRTGSVHVSERQRSILGFGPDATVDFPSFINRIHPEDRQWVMDAIRRSHDPSGDGLFECEHRLLIPGGAVRWISVRGQTYFEGDADRRRPARSVGASIDITHQRRSQDEQSKLAAAVAMSRDFIGIAMLDTRVDYLNPAALAMVGIGTLEEAREKKIADFMADRETVDKVLAGVRVDGYWAGEAQLRHFGDGSAIDVEITAFPIRDDLGNPTYLATVTRDIRERRKAEALHAQLEARLAQAARMEAIGRLAGGVAHDFNNMLTVILGYAEMGRAAGLSFETRLKQLTEIEMAARRSQEITRQLLGFSRQQIIEPVRLQLNELVAVLLHPLTRLIGEDVELTFHPAPDLWQITMDASQINQILLNLVVNARDAMPGGGRLTIETVNVNVSPEYSRFRPGATPGEYAVLAVSDNGVGMDAETMSHIFEPFFTTKWHNHGTGLGLATVFGVVRQNGGFVNVYSEPAHGATFRIYFPRTVVDSASPSMAAHAGVTHSGSGVVMLVEDDDLVRGLATIALESFGYTPLVAKNPAEALRLCAANATEIRLMLSDVVMPGMNGAELRDRVLALNPKIKVLFMSGYTSNVIVDRGVLKKGVNFISKPFDIDDLEMRLQEILAS